MSENKAHIEVKRGSDKNFGIVFGAVFLIIALFPLLHGEPLRLWSATVSAVFFVIAFIKPTLLNKLNTLWFNFGMALGSIIAPIVMMIVYFITVVPIGLIMRAIGKDILNQKIDREAKSYWIKREQPVGTMKDQF